ncbi:YmaF family protein [Clostridium perfringens]|nr:YmaF family protein [Clostridium perfringens]
MGYQNYKCQRDYDERKDRDCCCMKCCKKCCCEEMQTHVHEYEQSVKLAEEGDDRHNHRVAGVTGEVIPIHGGRNHVHKINNDRTDFLDHFHRICIFTGPAIRIPGTNKHVHLVAGQTTVVDGHFHEFLFTTQIDAPLV